MGVGGGGGWGVGHVSLVVLLAILSSEENCNFVLKGRKEKNVLFNDALSTFLFTDIWRLTYGKGPLR